MDRFEEFKASVLEAIAFTDCTPDDELHDCEFAPETLTRIEADCLSFWCRVGPLVLNTNESPAQAGHDFWLTRNGHGAGFWDGDWDHTPYAETLDHISKGYGTLELYKGDDGLIYAC